MIRKILDKLSGSNGRNEQMEKHILDAETGLWAAEREQQEKEAEFQRRVDILKKKVDTSMWRRIEEQEQGGRA